MGTLDSIYNNDTAMDLRSDYRVAFWKYSPDEAVSRLDAYVQQVYGDDERDWASYVISLAMFVHKYGISHPAAIERGIKAIDEIDSVYGDEFSRSDYKKLWNVKERLLKPQPAPKKIGKPNCSTPPVLQIGDVITLAVNSNIKGREGKRYILLQKVGDYLSWTSSFDPSVRSIAPVFMLFDYFEAQPPQLADLNHTGCKGVFTGIGNQRDYIRRELTVLGNLPVEQQYDRTAFLLYVLPKGDPFICQHFE